MMGTMHWMRTRPTAAISREHAEEIPLGRGGGGNINSLVISNTFLWYLKHDIKPISV